VLYALKSLGVGLYIDDFGTGYSSLQYLTWLPFDTLKIDRSFVTHMCDDEQSHDVIRTIADLAKSLGLGLVAEGVESEDQAKELLALGCRFAQGYYFSKPLSAFDAGIYFRASRSK
jgi:EAL domain-containing protein (putative c-di-GMP-specific phosphodiesterase class I)